MKYLSWLVIVVVCLSVFAGCDRSISESDKKQQAQTEVLMGEAQRQVGMPKILNFQQRKLMKAVYELTDREDLICYVYIVARYTGELKYIGKSIGFGVPFSAQFTNPEYIAYRSTNIGVLSLPQPDPNGLFMPSSSSATWLLMVDKDGQSRPVYLEPEIIVSPFPLHEG